eukprot:Em0017g413a
MHFFIKQTRWAGVLSVPKAGSSSNGGLQIMLPLFHSLLFHFKVGTPLASKNFRSTFLSLGLVQEVPVKDWTQVQGHHKNTRSLPVDFTAIKKMFLRRGGVLSVIFCRVKNIPGVHLGHSKYQYLVGEIKDSLPAITAEGKLAESTISEYVAVLYAAYVLPKMTEEGVDLDSKKWVLLWAAIQCNRSGPVLEVLKSSSGTTFVPQDQLRFDLSLKSVKTPWVYMTLKKSQKPRSLPWLMAGYLGLTTDEGIEERDTLYEDARALERQKELFVVKGGRSKDAAVAGLIEQTVIETSSERTRELKRMLVTCDKYGQGLTCTNHTRHNHRMASEEAIQLRGGDRLSDRLQASSHTSGVSQSPPAYEDEVRSSAVKSFTLPHGVPSFGDRPGQMTEEIHRTRSLQDINQLTLSRGTLGTYRTLPAFEGAHPNHEGKKACQQHICLDLKHVSQHQLPVPQEQHQHGLLGNEKLHGSYKGVHGGEVLREESESDMTLVPTVPLGVNNKSCPHYPSPYRFCTIQQPSYDLISLVTGRDGYNDTWLFLGHYVNMTVPYNRPVAYLVCTAVVYGISFFMLVISLVVLTAYRMTPIGHMTLHREAYVNNTVKFSSLVKANFCNKVFAAWDYKLRNSRAVKLKKAFIKIDLQEELVEHQKQSKARSSKDLLKIVLIRTVTNLIVLALMVGCGAAIIAATANSWKQLVAQKLNAIGLIVPILIIASIIILPIIFHVIAGFEQYKTQSGHEKMTLIRSSFVRISTLLIYIIAAFSAIECTQSKDIQLAALNTFKNNTTYCLGSCWETFIGQQFYNLQILEFLFIAIFTIVYESGRHGLYRAFHKRVQHKILKSILSRASFSISDSVNDLVYYQLLMW